MTLEDKSKFAQKCEEAGWVVGLNFDFAVGYGASTTEFPFDVCCEVFDVFRRMVWFESLYDLHDFTAAVSGGSSDAQFSQRLDARRRIDGRGRPRW
jgi:hypothetical protein